MEPRVPYYNVTIEGQDVTPWVSNVQVVEDDHETDSATITIPDPRMIYADALMEGCRAEISLGYAHNGHHALLLRALITKVELSYPESGVPTVKLKGQDRSIELGLVEKRHPWRNMKLTRIVRDIAAPYGFADVQAKLSPDPQVASEVQDAKTDLEFLQNLAKKYHAKCFVELDEQDREVLYFIGERAVVGVRRPEQLLLRYRQGPTSNLLSFSPTFDASFIDRRREVHDLDNRGQRVSSPPAPPVEVAEWPLAADLRSRASARDFERVQALYDAGARERRALQEELAAPRPHTGEVARNQEELTARTGALESRRFGLTATGTTVGTIWLRAKSNVEITGAGERFSGEWYVSRVTHTVDTGGYKTEFKAVR